LFLMNLCFLIIIKTAPILKIRQAAKFSEPGGLPYRKEV
jgi:hypothetical protein